MQTASPERGFIVSIGSSIAGSALFCFALIPRIIEHPIDFVEYQPRYTKNR